MLSTHLRSMSCFAFLCIAACASLAQQALFSNASAQPNIPALNPQPSAANGTPAPNGFMWSEATSSSPTEANSLAGVACSFDSTDPSGGVRLADDLVVPEGQNWNLSEVWLYAYVPGWSSLTPPVSSATLRIWGGTPGQPLSGVVWGDDASNRLDAVDATSMYRIFSSIVGPEVVPPDTSRRIYRVVMHTQASLPPGRYWLDWRLTAQSPASEVFAVPVTLANQRTHASWNAMQLADHQWSSIVDPGKPAVVADVGVDLAFVVFGSQGSACDSIDFNADGLFPDTQDLDDFISVFGGGSCSTGACNDVDFNNDGLFPDTLDVESFVSVFMGGPCR